ncbi:hypothetical protein G6F58_008585 [Rhizopus delemar]|nr:hypothetical protein G6F58_008585 [Rhizopus delemar]
MLVLIDEPMELGYTSKVEYNKQYASNFRNTEFKIYTTLLSNEEKEDIKTRAAEGSLTKESLISLTPNVDKNLLVEFTKSLDNEDPYETLYQMAIFEKLLKASRSYNLDTTPKLLHSREELVEVLIRSGVGRYLEFKSVDDIYMFNKIAEQLEKVPGSKEDVFTNKSISLIEKRKLMKFLTYAVEHNGEDIELEDMSYSKFLEEKFKISDKLLDAIVYAIALVDKDASVKHGLDCTHKFVQSIGRFGKGGYLCPLYGGASEIAQAFCRICAVYGGIYILNSPIDKILVNNETNECTGLVTKEGQEYNCKTLISGIDYLPLTWLPSGGDFGTWVSRAIVITNHPLKDTEAHDALAYSIFPPGSNAGNVDFPIYIIHQSQESVACPKDQYVTYFWTTSQNEGVLKNALELLLKKKKEDGIIEQYANCIFSIFYDQRIRSTKDLEQVSNLPRKIIPCSDPDISLDFQTATTEAIKLFYQCEGKDGDFMPAVENDPENEYQ